MVLVRVSDGLGLRILKSFKGGKSWNSCLKAPDSKTSDLASLNLRHGFLWWGPDPKGPCTQILYTLGPMYPYRDLP